MANSTVTETAHTHHGAGSRPSRGSASSRDRIAWWIS